MHDHPPISLYETMFTAEAMRSVPGSPIWCYDGQFIWFPKNSQLRSTYILSLGLV